MDANIRLLAFVVSLGVVLVTTVTGCRLTIPGGPQRDAAVDAATQPDASTLMDVSSQDAALSDAGLPDAAPDVAPIPDAAPPDAGPPPHNCNPTGGLDCSPGSGTGGSNQCWDGPSCYISSVQSAVNGTISAHPSWFTWDNTIPCWIILDVNSFMDAVVVHIQGQGLCVIRDPNAPGEEITVKHDNAFSENFDIVSSAGCARAGTATYTGYCVPAWW